MTAAVFEGGQARPIPGHTLYDMLRRAEMENVALPALLRAHASTHAEDVGPCIPLQPREVWACGCTYESSSSFRDGEHGTREGFYAAVNRGNRPEVFFKGTARVCVGPGKEIGIRSDSRFTAPEPELALVLGARGKVLGYTLANDVSAWDIERENPLYLPQSKMYAACCALGPVIVTTDEIPDPYALEIRCTVKRGGETIFDGSASTSKMCWKLDRLLEFLLRSNPVPSGSVLLTGTGVIVPETAALQPGDEVTVSVPGIGELTNRAALV
jgi:2-dehydro-3-deoxy-D-arabinonate dehydratase